MKQIVGRSEAIATVIALLSHCRFLTIVGSPGVGKTTVAIAVAEAQLQIYRDGVFFVDFSSVNDASGVTRAISTALGLLATAENANAQLSAYLQCREILLVVDTCEHVLCSVAECLELIQSCCPNVHILVTSREPLGTRGEGLYRLPPLDVPSANSELTVDTVRAFPAVELLLKRATETLGELRIDDSQATTIAELCRQLDGIPLAIELAAVRVRLLGFAGLSSMANDDFLQFRQSRRTGPRRHESLAAAHEWSFVPLPENERAVLLRLSALTGSFDLETAVSVASGGLMSPAETTACVAILVSKSLVERPDNGASKFRLLHLVRYFASKKLASRNDFGEKETNEEHFATARWDVRSCVAAVDPLTA